MKTEYYNSLIEDKKNFLTEWNKWKTEFNSSELISFLDTILFNYFYIEYGDNLQKQFRDEIIPAIAADLDLLNTLIAKPQKK